jgi:hypothetical protein
MRYHVILVIGATGTNGDETPKQLDLQVAPGACALARSKEGSQEGRGFAFNYYYWKQLTEAWKAKRLRCDLLSNIIVP